MTRTLSALGGTVLLAAALVIPPAVHAADNKPRETRPAAAKPAPLLLSPAQLRECLDRQQALRARADEAERKQAALTASKAEIDRLGTALKEQLATLDRTSADAVAAYNAQAAARDKMIDQYQEGVPLHNTEVEALKADRAAHAKACENKRYDEADEMMIRKGK
jgi:hypothetical protein